MSRHPLGRCTAPVAGSVNEPPIPPPHATGSGPHTSPGGITAIRREIDEVDRRLVDLLARRCDLARATGQEKAAAGRPVEDLEREARVVRAGAELARLRGLDEEGVRQILWCVIDLARTAQSEAGRGSSRHLGPEGD